MTARTIARISRTFFHRLPLRWGRVGGPGGPGGGMVAETGCSDTGSSYCVADQL